MRNKSAKRIRKETRRHVNRFIATNFRQRLKLAWRIARGK